ncbi:MAG: hypothetical protein Q4C51_01575 [Clostridia bacterium]|nr:hypothetical protein [Clostridia bacterium]
MKFQGKLGTGNPKVAECAKFDRMAGDALKAVGKLGALPGKNLPEI